MQYNYKIQNLKELQAKMAKAPEVTERWIKKGVAAATMAIFKKATRGIVPWKTGTLVQTMQTEVNGMKGRVYPTRNYALFVHEGTRPHVILPKLKKALWWPGAAHPMRSVNHPGTRANPFMPRMLEAALPEVNRIFKDVNENIAKEIK